MALKCASNRFREVGARDLIRNAVVIREAQKAGARTLREIAQALNAEGYPRHVGANGTRNWSRTSSRVLRTIWRPS